VRLACTTRVWVDSTTLQVLCKGQAGYLMLRLRTGERCVR